MIEIYTKKQGSTDWILLNDEYSCAAEPPVRCGESHHSGLGEPPFVTYLACLGSNPYTSRMDLSFEGSMHSMFIL